MAQQPVRGRRARHRGRGLPAGYRINGAVLRPARVVVAAVAMARAQRLLQDPRASTRRPPRRTSRRRTASSRASTTRTPTRTPGPRSASRQISEAYDVLGDPEKRKKYDRGGSRVRRRATRSAAAAAAAAARRGRLRLVLGHPVGHLQHAAAARRHAHEAGGRARHATSRPRSRCPSSRRSRARRCPVSVATHVAVHDLPRHRRAAGHLAQGLPGLQRPRRRGPGPGRVLDHPPVLALRRLGHRDRGAVPDLRRRGPAARAQEATA